MSAAEAVAPAKKSLRSVEMYVPRQDDDWTNSAYERLNGDGLLRSRTKNGNRRIHSIIFSVFSVFLLLLGVTLCIYMTVRASSLQTPGKCYTSSYSFMVPIFYGSLLFLTGLVGLGLICHETKIGGILFLVLLVLLTFFVLLAGFLISFVYVGVKSNRDILEFYWKQSVLHSSREICDFQKLFKCSGFNPSHCCVSNVTNTSDNFLYPCYLRANDGITTLDPITLKPVLWPIQECSLMCNASNVYNNTCEKPLKNMVFSFFPFLFGGLLAAGLLFAGFVVFAVYRFSAARREVYQFYYEF